MIELTFGLFGLLFALVATVGSFLILRENLLDRAARRERFNTRYSPDSNGNYPGYFDPRSNIAYQPDAQHNPNALADNLIFQPTAINGRRIRNPRPGPAINDYRVDVSTDYEPSQLTDHTSTSAEALPATSEVLAILCEAKRQGRGMTEFFRDELGITGGSKFQSYKRKWEGIAVDEE